MIALPEEHPTSTQSTLQTVLLLVATLMAVWVSLYHVPWRISADPCLLAVVAALITLGFLWFTRWQGSRGANFERKLFAAFLAGMPIIYVTRYFATTGPMIDSSLCLELLGVVVFAAPAVLGLKRSPWFLAIGIPAHGLAWDSWHYHNSSYIPDWYAILCLIVDVAYGAYAIARIPAYRRAAGY